MPSNFHRSSFAIARAATALWLVGSSLFAQQQAWDRAAIDGFVTAQRQRTLDAAAQKGLPLPADFVAWVDLDPLRQRAVYGCRKDPLPVLLGLRSLEIELGEPLVRQDYPQLALAFAMQGSYRVPSKKASGWNDGDDGGPGERPLPDVSPRQPATLVIPGDPRVPVDTKAKDRALDVDDHVINFLEDHAPIEVEVTQKELPPLEYDDKGVAKPRGKAVAVTKKVARPLVGADVIADPALQLEFNQYMAGHGHADVKLECGDHVVHWKSSEAVHDKAQRERIAAAHELFHRAYRNKGRMPAERDRAPSQAESFLWFVRNDREPLNLAQQQALKTARFPLSAPWPLLLMLVADDQPLREREDIWRQFRDDAVFRTYGEYIGGIAQQFDMQSARRVSPYAFSYGSIQMMWKDGGVCGTMGNIGARTYRIAGVPSSTAGQPGHCAIVRMEYEPKDGSYRCVGGQYATGGDEVTTVHAGWNFDDDGGRRPMVFWQTVARGVSRDVGGFVDGLVLRRMWDAASPEVKAAGGEAFARAALQRDPFALAAVLGAIDAAPSAAQALVIGEVFAEVVPDGKELQLYRDTVRDLVHARVLALPAPQGKTAALELARRLEHDGCENAALLARTWRGIGGDAEFTQRCVAAVQRYVASPERTADKRASAEFARLVQGFEHAVKGKGQRRDWAATMLDAFAGHEALRVRKKVSLDPAVAALCKTAGREPPQVSK
ncbi:MAG: hypothetical protein H6835_12695 [Planctomycetes bacterium]|nr:hypothetical protein [Planctomycetota bacterium]